MTFSIHGLAVARGIAIGRAVLVASSRVDVAHYFITAADVESEIARVRVARNAVSEEVARIQQDPAKTFADVRELMAGVRGRENVLRDGDMDGGIWTSGQSQALIHEVASCADVVKSIMAQAESVRAMLAAM